MDCKQPWGRGNGARNGGIGGRRREACLAKSGIGSRCDKEKLQHYPLVARQSISFQSSTIRCQLLRSNIRLSIQECGVLEGGGRGARLPNARACQGGSRAENATPRGRGQEPEESRSGTTLLVVPAFKSHVAFSKPQLGVHARDFSLHPPPPLFSSGDCTCVSGQSIHVLGRTLGSSCCVLANPFKVSYLRDDTIIGLSLQIIDSHTSFRREQSAARDLSASSPVRTTPRGCPTVQPQRRGAQGGRHEAITEGHSWRGFGAPTAPRTLSKNLIRLFGENKVRRAS